MLLFVYINCSKIIRGALWIAYWKILLADSKDFQFIDYVLKQTLENNEIEAYLNYMLNVVQGDKSAHPYNQLLDYKIKN